MSRSAEIVSRHVTDLVGFECVAGSASSRIVDCKDGRSFTVEVRKLDSKQVDIDGVEWTLKFDEFSKSLVLERWSETDAQAKANAKVKASVSAASADAASGELPA